MTHRLIVTATLLFALGASGCGVAVPLASQPAAGSLRAQDAPTGNLTFDRSVMGYATRDILGIGPVFAAKLEKQAITTADQLLHAGATRGDRERLEKLTGIPHGDLLTWIDHCDMMRVTGCGPEYARLLERAGVHSAMELAQRNAIHLAQALEAANPIGAGRVCVHKVPDVITASAWVLNAKTFQRVVSY